MTTTPEIKTYEGELCECPYCGERHYVSANSVTRYGSLTQEGHPEWCRSCEKMFRVVEQVTRTYQVAKVCEESGQ